MSAQPADETRDGVRAPQPSTRPRGAAWTRLAVLVLLVLAAVAVASDLQSPARSAVTLAFLLLGPGLALADVLRVDDALQRLSLAIGASLAIDTLVAVGLLYVERYSYELAFGIVAAITALVLAAGTWQAVSRPAAGGPPERAIL